MSYVYAILAPNIGIKIGYSSHPRRRLSNLNTASAVDLELLMAVPGTLAHEAYLLEILSPHRLRGEWFSLHADVYDLLAKVKSGDWGDFVPVSETKIKSKFMERAEKAARYIQKIAAIYGDEDQDVDPVIWKFLYRSTEPSTEEYIHLMNLLASSADSLATISHCYERLSRDWLSDIEDLNSTSQLEIGNQINNLAGQLADRLAQRGEE